MTVLRCGTAAALRAVASRARCAAAAAAPPSAGAPRRPSCATRLRCPARSASFGTAPPARAMSSTPAAAPPAAPAEGDDGPVVQYVVLRKDLRDGLGWPMGSVVAQACHASVAAVWLHRDDPATQAYCSPEKLDAMHKVVLEVKGEPQLRTLSAALEAAGVAHKLWTEQPENVATCLATKPYPKQAVAAHFKKLNLCK